MSFATQEDAILHELREIREQLSLKPSQLSLGGADADGRVANAPTPFSDRYVVSRMRAIGNDNFIVAAATATKLIGKSAGRIGGNLINIGANPCFVYLTDVGDVNFGNGGRFTMWLSANGGSWDFKISSELWTGPVAVYSVLGTTLVYGVT